MLEFYLNVSDSDGALSNKAICEFSLQEIKWLSKFGVIKNGKTGLLEDDGPETLPFFDDYILEIKHIQSMRARFLKRSKELGSASGFNSSAMNKLGTMLEQAIDNHCSIRVECD